MFHVIVQFVCIVTKCNGSKGDDRCPTKVNSQRKTLLVLSSP